MRPMDRSGAKPNAPLGGVWFGRSPPWRGHGGVLHRLGGRNTGRARGDAYRSGVPATKTTYKSRRTQVPQAAANRRRPWRPRRPGGANAWNGTWSCWPGGEARTPWGPPHARPITVAEVSSPVPAADGTAMIENVISPVQRSLSWRRLRGRPPSPWPSRRLPAGRFSPEEMIESVIYEFKLWLMNVSACEPCCGVPAGPWIGIPAAVGDPSPLTHPAEVGRAATLAGIRILKVLHDGC